MSRQWYYVQNGERHFVAAAVTPEGAAAALDRGESVLLVSERELTAIARRLGRVLVIVARRSAGEPTKARPQQRTAPHHNRLSESSVRSGTTHVPRSVLKVA